MISIRIFHSLPKLSEPLTVTVLPCFRTEFLRFGDLTDYSPCDPGFHIVTVTGSESRRVYLQKTLPFFTPTAFTLALITASHGMDILSIPDYPCFCGRKSACFRTINLTDTPMRYHLFHYGDWLLFSDVWFRQITSHKRLPAGKHGIYLKLPEGCAPLIPSVFEAKAGEAYSAFVYGSLPEDTLSLLVQKDTPGRDQLSIQ